MRTAVGACAVLAAALLWTSQVGVLRQPEMSGDILTTHVIRDYARGVYEGTRDPSWNPMLQMGYPFHAESEGALFYPVQILLFVLLPLDPALVASAFLHVGGMALFAFLFFRQAGLSAPAAALASVVFVGSGYWARHHGHEWSYRTGMWFPLILYLTHRTCTDRNRWVPPGLSLAVGCQWLAGHFNLAYWTALAAAAYAICLLGRRVGGFSRGMRLAVAYALGLAIAAVQVLPTAELSALSHRAEGVGTGPFAAYSFWPVHAIRFLFPSVAVDLPGTANGNETDPYVGILPLALAGVGLFFGRDPGARRRRWLLAATGLLLLGVFFPPNLLLYKLLPGYAAFRGPVRAIFLVSFLLAWCAGAGLDALARATPAARRRLALGLAVAALGTGLAVVAVGALAAPLGDAGARLIGWTAQSGFPKSPAVHAENLRGYLAQFAGNATLASSRLWGPLALAGLAAAWIAWGAGRRGGAWIALALSAADLTFYARSLAPVPLWAARFPDRFSQEIAFLQRDTDPFRIFCWPAREHRVDGIRFPGTYYFQRFGIANVASTTPRLAAAARFDTLWRTSGHAFTPAELYASLDLLGRLGVKYVLSDGSLTDERLEEVFSDRLRVYRNRSCRGRVRIEEGQGEARIVGEGDGRLEVAVDAPAGGTLVVADNPYPAWHAEVDGAPAMIRPGPEGLGRRVDLPAGARRVTFRYDSPADRAGLAVSLAALGAVVVWGLWLTARMAPRGEPDA